MLTPDQSTQLKAQIGGLIDALTEGTPPPPPPPAPTASISVSPSQIEDSHDGSHSATLTWITTNADHVTINGQPEPASGSMAVIGPAVGSHSFSMAASGPGGTAMASATLTVVAHTHPPDPGTPPHPDDPDKQAEHSAAMALVPADEATLFVAADQTEEITGDVTHDGGRTEGKLVLLGGCTLRIETLIGTPTSTLQIGTPENPITLANPVKVIFRDTGPITDPFMLGRGIIWHGKVRIYGEPILPDLARAKAWAGEQITLNRAVVFESEATDIARRGHIMFMHNRDVVCEGALFRRVGRTDKSRVLTDPDGKGGGLDNPRGRYSVHGHRLDGSKSDTPARFRYLAIEDSPGWGVVNHDGLMLVEDCESYNVFGAHFATEIGNEMGAFRRNVAIYSKGSKEGVESGRNKFDWGHVGTGVWVQGGGTVEVSDNYAVGCPFAYVHMGQEASWINQANLDDPSIWLGAAPFGARDKVPSADVPLRFWRNQSRSVGAHSTGLTIWALHTNHYHKTDSQVFDCDFQDGRILIGYSGFVHFKSNSIINTLPNPPWAAIGNTSESISGMTYEDLTIKGWKVGIENPCTGDGTSVGAKPCRILGGKFDNKFANITILNSQPNSDGSNRKRTLLIDGQQQYAPGSEWNIRMALEFFSWDIRPLEAGTMTEANWRRLFDNKSPWPSPPISPLDNIMLGDEQLEFAERSPSFPLWPLLKNKFGVATVGELAEQHGLVVGGRPLKAGRVEPKVRGWLTVME